MNPTTRFTFRLNLFLAILVGVVTASAIGCARTDQEPAPEEEINPNAVNYSMAEPLELPILKSKKEFIDFTKESEIAVVKFGAEWCPPCKALAPELQKIAGYFQTENVRIAEIDVDEVGDLSRELKINSIPYTVVYYNGNFYTDVNGYAPDTIASLLQSLCQETAESSSADADAETSDEEDAVDLDETFDEAAAE